MRFLHKPFTLLAAAVLTLAPTNSARAEDFPKGTFSLKGPMDVMLSITFDGKGKMTAKRDGEEMLQVEYKVTKDEVEFSNESGPKGNPNGPPGTYKWKLDGKKLTFTKVKDESGGRAEALTHGTWEKKD